MSKMVTKAVAVFALSFAFVGHFLQTLCWKRGENSRFFDGAVFFHRNFALETDILRKVITTGEIQCGFACLSENDCIAQTFCLDSWKKTKGTCYLHKNGIKPDEQTVGVLIRRDSCTFQQYIDFYVSSLKFCFVNIVTQYGDVKPSKFILYSTTIICQNINVTSDALNDSLFHCR